MDEKTFNLFVSLVFLYFVYRQFGFRANRFHRIIEYIEAFTPRDVQNIIQPPGSNKIGSINKKIWNETQTKVVSNGYTEEVINNLKPTNPEPINSTDTLGDFPTTLNGNYILPTTEFEYPNDYKFTVEYPCRKTATGMFTNCGVHSANLAWSANPYKGLQCELTNTKTPEINNNFNTNSETQYGQGDLQRGISSIGNSMFR